ncbi:MAG: redoxin domain-containing protein [Oscillochloris sp.]|nr:redoxin domain-containing protein [Oscillochloris sp.]
MMLHTTQPQLRIGKVVPTFGLPDLRGNEVKRSVERGRRHLALLFLEQIDISAEAYLREVTQEYAAIREADGTLMAVLSDPAAAADELRAKFDFPFPLLLDRESTARSKFLPADASCGLFILDRYGALHAQWTLSAPPFPPVSEIVEWLHVLDRQCSL